jgi:hypothetical protein
MPVGGRKTKGGGSGVHIQLHRVAPLGAKIPYFGEIYEKNSGVYC